jgi:hypothetical protein
MFDDDLPKDSRGRIYTTIRKILQAEIDGV